MMIEKLKQKYNQLGEYEKGLLHGITIAGLSITILHNMVG